MAAGVAGADGIALSVGSDVLIQSRHKGKVLFVGTTVRAPAGAVLAAFGPGSSNSTWRFWRCLQDFDPQGRIWIGVELARPIGKHNGTVRGKVYFKAEDKHGTFVQPKQVCAWQPQRRWPKPASPSHPGEAPCFHTV